MTSMARGAATSGSWQAQDVLIEPVGLAGQLNLASPSRGLVLFAHGAGSSRLSPRNTHVAAALSEAGLSTLLFDLLTLKEADDRANVFDIDLLTERLMLATSWAQRQDSAGRSAIGYFGASTGAAAALRAAADMAGAVHAVVSRGGRPDLAYDALARVRAPTLLIVGGRDYGVIELNRRAFEKLNCQKQLTVIEGATHLFEEPGTLDAVVDAAKDWFLRYLTAGVGSDGETR